MNLRVAIFLIPVCLLFSYCTNSEQSSSETGEQTAQNNAAASPASANRPDMGKGDRPYGGTLRFGHQEKVQTLYPKSITDLTSANVALQVFEGLVKFDQRTLEIVPSLATSWEISENGLEYTFHLAPEAKWQDDACFKGGKGRAVTANDVKYTFEQLCTQDEDNLAYSFSVKDKLKGANAYWEASANSKPNFDLEGVTVLDDHTVKLTLDAPSNSFLYVMAQASTCIVPEEGVAKYGNQLTVGSGPFRWPAEQAFGASETMLLRNPTYHKTDSLGNQLPFVDTVLLVAYESKHVEVSEFKSGVLDVVNSLPSEAIKELVEEQIASFSGKKPRFVLDRTPEMSTSYYQFNVTKEQFSDKRVRQAFNYAIDRQKIIDHVLKGEAYGPGRQGMTPPSFPGYNTDKIEGYTFDPERAQQLFAQAGYPKGKGFPTVMLELNTGGQLNARVAAEVQKQLKQTLGVNIELEVLDFSERMANDRWGRSSFVRKAWIADYPGPESFLMLFYGKTVPESLEEPSYPNTSRYRSEQFDELFEKGVQARSSEESYQYFLEAEQVMMRDAPVIVLWYSEIYKLWHSRVNGFYSNAMDFWDFSLVYLGEVPAEAAN